MPPKRGGPNARSTYGKNAATDKAKWTVMVYMAAGDDAGLDANAVSDLQEMERAGVGRDINVVVQFDRYWPALGQRYRIAKGRTELIEGNVSDPPPRQDSTKAPAAPAAARGLDMGSGRTLEDYFDEFSTFQPIAMCGALGTCLRPRVRPRSWRSHDADGAPHGD